MENKKMFETTNQLTIIIPRQPRQRRSGSCTRWANSASSLPDTADGSTPPLTAASPAKTCPTDVPLE
jgi:hypothetical protein